MFFLWYADVAEIALNLIIKKKVHFKGYDYEVASLKVKQQQQQQQQHTNSNKLRHRRKKIPFSTFFELKDASSKCFPLCLLCENKKKSVCNLGVSLLCLSKQEAKH